MIEEFDKKNNMCIYQPEDINDLFEFIAQEQSVPLLKRHRSPFVYRGVSKYDYELTTNLQRNECDNGLLEYHLLRNFRKYCSAADDLSDVSLWKLMAIAQHHGLPTRLLDWTFSPFVALHFATNQLDDYKDDGAVYCVNYLNVHEDLPFSANEEKRVSDAKMFSTRMLEGMVRNTIDTLKNNSSKIDTIIKMKENYKYERSIRTQLGIFKDTEYIYNNTEKEFVLFFEPPSIDERIFNQYALFSLASSAKCNVHRYLTEFNVLENVNTNDKKNTFYKINIPNDMKWQIRNRLDQYNITERVLSPGYDGLAAYLKRHYGPAPKTDKLGVVP